MPSHDEGIFSSIQISLFRAGNSLKTRAVRSARPGVLTSRGFSINEGPLSCPRTRNVRNAEGRPHTPKDRNHRPGQQQDDSLPSGPGVVVAELPPLTRPSPHRESAEGKHVNCSERASCSKNFPVTISLFLYEPILQKFG